MLRLFCCALIGLLLASCAASKRAQLAGPPPRLLELRREQGISTIHFPRGDYSLGEEDRDGYYYEVPGHVIKHAFAGSVPFRGGIFVSKKNHRFRGYTIWAGGRTRIGEIPASAVRFHD